MSSALANVAWEPCLIEPRSVRAVEARARERFGMLHPPVGYFAAVPWVAHAVIDLHAEFGLLVQLDQATADMIVLVVSQENACRFCYAAVRTVLWCQGMDAQRIERAEQDLAATDLAPRVRAAMAYARSQSRTGPAGAHKAWAALREAGFSALEAKEVAFTVALTDFANRMFTIPAIPALPMERLPEQLGPRLLRPLIDWLMRRHRFRGRAVPDTQSPALPYGRLVGAFAGSPIAGALCATLQALWASEHLPRRCKLLMFAVVSRALPCELCETEVGEALQREGLDAATLSQALDHLDAPALTDVERLLLPFVRETLWYEPAALQRRARALRDRLSDEQFIEAIGVVALANGLCRMAAVVMAEPA